MPERDLVLVTGHAPGHLERRSSSQAGSPIAAPRRSFGQSRRSFGFSRPSTDIPAVPPVRSKSDDFNARTTVGTELGRDGKLAPSEKQEHGSSKEPALPAAETALPTAHLDEKREEPASVSSDSAMYTDGPPSLEYTIMTKKRIIFMVCFWTLVTLDSIGLPIGLYFGLTYGLDPKANGDPRLSMNTVFSIVTAAIGGISIVEYFLRSWRLWKKESTCRVVGVEGQKYARWYFDWFHVIFTSTWLILMVELIIGSIGERPPMRLVAMPPSSLLFVFGMDMLIRSLCRWRDVRYPVRISSQPRHAVLLPAVYPFIEDIVAADGGGGTAYRERLARRYHASHVFRSMLERMTVFWTFGCLAMATVTTILIFTLEKDWGYAVGWSAPFVWAALWSLSSWIYVERMLKIERATWGQKTPA